MKIMIAILVLIFGFSGSALAASPALAEQQRSLSGKIILAENDSDGFGQLIPEGYEPTEEPTSYGNPNPTTPSG